MYKMTGFKYRQRCLWAAVVAAVILAFNSVVILPANRIGVLYNPFSGGTQNNVLQEGINLKAPWNDVYLMSTSIKLLTLKDITVQTKGGQWLKVEMQVQLSISPTDAMLYYRKYRNTSLDDDYLRNILSATVQREVENVLVQYDIMEVMTEKKGEINHTVDKVVSDALAKDGIVVSRAIITDADAGDAIEKQIESIQVAKLAAEEAEYLKDKAIKEGEAEVEKARKLAEANEILAKSLNKNILTAQLIEAVGKWQPLYIGDIKGVLDVAGLR